MRFHAVVLLGINVKKAGTEMEPEAGGRYLRPVARRCRKFRLGLPISGALSPSVSLKLLGADFSSLPLSHAPDFHACALCPWVFPPCLSKPSFLWSPGFFPSQT